MIHGFRKEALDESLSLLANRSPVRKDRAAFADRHARQAPGRRQPGDQRHRSCREVGLPLVRCAARLRYTQNALQPLRALGGQGRVDRSLPRASRRRRAIRACDDRQLRRPGAPLGGWLKRGEQSEAIGRSRGGRMTKIQAMTNSKSCPIKAYIADSNANIAGDYIR